MCLDSLGGQQIYSKTNQLTLNPKKKHIITTKIEHPSILEVCKMLEHLGARISYLDVDKEGFIDLKQLEKEIGKDTLLVSIIHGNNEIGTIQNLEEIGKLCRKKGVLFHIDACQSFTKTLATDLPTGRQVSRINTD